jgi:hypothetical protein
MAGSMIVLAAALLVAGLVGLVAEDKMALSVHGLMMPAMLVPMLVHLDHYTGRRVRRYSSKRGVPAA